MATFLQLIEDLAQQEVVVTPQEVQRLSARFGKLTYSIGLLNEDGSLTVPVDCIVEAVHEIGARRLGEALETGDSTVLERIASARENKVRVLAAAVQNAATDEEAQRHWRELEHLMFGV